MSYQFIFQIYQINECQYKQPCYGYNHFVLDLIFPLIHGESKSIIIISYYFRSLKQLTFLINLLSD
jgi:hypothetical protein